MLDFLENPNWWVAFGTILLAFVAIFQDKIRSMIWRPKLDCIIELKPPDCHRTKSTLKRMTDTQQLASFYSYYYRFAIWNNGNISAKNVEVMITDVLKKEGKDFKRIEAFTPDNLLWSILHKDFPSNSFKTYCDYISPDTFKHCNLGHIHDPKYRKKITGEDNPEFKLTDKETIFCFDVNFKSNALYYLIPPGEYKISIKVGCENAKTISRSYLIKISGKWFGDDETRMLNEGFYIEQI